MAAQCSVDGFCPAMSKYCNADDKTRGIHCDALFDLDLGDYNGAKLLYYKLDKKDRGIILNWCPWCGADMKFLREKREA